MVTPPPSAVEAVIASEPIAENLGEVETPPLATYVDPDTAEEPSCRIPFAETLNCE